VILLDTHVAVWFVTNTAFGKRTMAIVDAAQAEARLAVSAISFWEIALLVARRRLRAIRSTAEQRTKILTAGTLELPLTGEIAILAGELDRLHSDPADRFIAATAIVHDATLVTADEKLLCWRRPLRRQNAEL
jgi:PIN domain nuclease of toxin-antitoxin system